MDLPTPTPSLGLEWNTPQRTTAHQGIIPWGYRSGNDSTASRAVHIDRTPNRFSMSSSSGWSPNAMFARSLPSTKRIAGPMLNFSVTSVTFPAKLSILITRMYGRFSAGLFGTAGSITIPRTKRQRPSRFPLTSKSPITSSRVHAIEKRSVRSSIDASTKPLTVILTSPESGRFATGRS